MATSTVETGMAMYQVSAGIGKLVNYWDRYKPIWDMDKDAFIRRYANTSRPLSSYDMDITR